jgi:hypothetical protein
MHQEIASLRKALHEKEAHIISLQSALVNCERSHGGCSNRGSSNGSLTQIQQLPQLDTSQTVNHTNNSQTSADQDHSNSETEAYNSTTIVPPNPYLKQEIPHFIKVYALAPSKLDALLDWNIFSVPQLEYFLGMLNRLWRNDLEDIVSRYENQRMTLQSLINEISSQPTNERR